MKKTIKGFVHMSTNPYDRGEFFLSSVNMGDSGLRAVFVKQIEVEVDIPDDFDGRALQIEALRKANKQAAADFHALQTDIMRQIHELQALEMT